jgi:hypothetical protein
LCYPSPVVSDAADSADGIFDSCTHPDDPASGSAFTTERNVDAQCPEERLRAAQAASEGTGIFGPGCGVGKSIIALRKKRLLAGRSHGGET